VIGDSFDAPLGESFAQNESVELKEWVLREAGER
jgi:hypothetical protein